MATTASAPSLDQNVSKFISKTHKILINGKWVEAASGKTFPTYNPATGDVLSRVAEGDKEDINRAVKAARAAFDSGPWSKITPSERGRMIWKLGGFDRKAPGRIRATGIARQRQAAEGRARCRRAAGRRSVPLHGRLGHQDRRQHHSHFLGRRQTQFLAYTLREPIGVVGQIIPWNFPLLMAAWKLGPALATGCTVVLKPAEQTPLTALLLGELIQEAGIPDGVVNIVPGYGETAGAALAAHPDVDKVAFTGSTEVGKLIVQAAAGNLKKVSLELGGKSPNIILDDADVEAAIPGAASAIFFNHGQCCCAGSRLYRRKRYFRQGRGGRCAACQQDSHRPRNGSLERHGSAGFRRATESRVRLSGVGNLGRRQGRHRRLARRQQRLLRQAHGAGEHQRQDESGARGNFRAGGHRHSLPQRRGNRRAGQQLQSTVWRPACGLATSRKPTRSPACFAPEPCGSIATTCSTPPCPSADTNSPAGAAKWATKSSSSTPRSRPSARRFRNSRVSKGNQVA